MIIRGCPCLDIVDGCSGVGVKDHVVHVFNCPGRPLWYTFYHVLWWSWVTEKDIDFIVGHPDTPYKMWFYEIWLLK